MNIALNEIDPEVAAHYTDMLTVMDPKRGLAARRRLSRKGLALLAFSILAPPVIGFGMGSTVWEATHSTPGAWATWLSVWFGGTGIGVRSAIRLLPKARSNSNLHLEEMKAAFPQLSLSRAERIYCDLLLFLVRTEANSDGETVLRDTLRQINELLASSRQLETRRLSLLPLKGVNVQSELQKEYSVLERRLQAATDPIVRASLEQSLRMVTSRIENARNLEVGLERLNVQQEAITQTLTAALSSLARMQLSTDQPRAEFAIQDISQSVTEMNRQTYAVEQAVEEVISLRPSY